MMVASSDDIIHNEGKCIMFFSIAFTDIDTDIDVIRVFEKGNFFQALRPKIQ